MSNDRELQSLLMSGVDDIDDRPGGMSGVMRGGGAPSGMRERNGGGGRPPESRLDRGSGGGGQQAAPAKGHPGFLNVNRAERRSPILGLALVFLFGIPLWVVNAEYTAQSIPPAINTASVWFRSPTDFGRLDLMYSLPLGIVIGILITLGQFREFPFDFARLKMKQVTFYGWGILFGWIFISGIDFFSTVYGFVQLPPDPWPIHEQAANSWFWTGAYSFFLAFGPEFAVAIGWKMLGWPIPSWFKRDR